jgi:beta-galactosidase
MAGSVDIVSPQAHLRRYRLVVVPDPGVMSTPQALYLAQYVRHGGHLILGPGGSLAADAAGLGVDVLFGQQGGGCHELREPLSVLSASGSGSAGIEGEDLSVSATHARVLLRYGVSDSPLSGKVAAVLLQQGRGTVIRLGAVLDPALTSAFLERSLATSGSLSRFGPLPPDVELLPRMGEQRQIFILVNHGEMVRSVLLPARMRDVENGWRRVRQASLLAHGVAVLVPDGGMRPWRAIASGSGRH